MDEQGNNGTAAATLLQPLEETPLPSPPEPVPPAAQAASSKPQEVAPPPSAQPTSAPQPEPTTASSKLNKRRIVALVVTVALCCLLIYFGRSVAMQVARRAWGSLRLVNFFVNLTPTILSILFAFIVDKDLELHMRRVWRVSIILCGLIWSGLLWHQQTLADKQADNQIRGSVQQAMADANRHTDELFKTANQHADTKFGEVEGDVKGVSDQNIALSQDLAKATGEINANLGKVGKPDPPVPAELVFSLWDTSATIEKPTLAETVQPDKDGNFPVDFTFVNASGPTAEEVDFWIQICDQCSFAKDPPGFEKLPGTEDHIRHKMIGALNPGVSLERTTIIVKAPSNAPFQIAFRYSCKTCGEKIRPSQIATIFEGAQPSPTPQ